MPNITKAKEADLATQLANQILISWEQNGITIKSLASKASGIPIEGLNSDFDPIEEESQTKAMKIFQEFQSNGKIDARDFADLNEIQIVNKFLSQHESAMKVRPYIAAFKADHTKRYLAMTLEKQTKSVSVQKKQAPGSTRNLAAEKKVKDHILNDALKQHTFKPQINARSKAMLIKSKEIGAEKPDERQDTNDREPLYSEPQMESFQDDVIAPIKHEDSLLMNEERSVHNDRSLNLSLIQNRDCNTKLTDRDVKNSGSKQSTGLAAKVTKKVDANKARIKSPELAELVVNETRNESSLEKPMTRKEKFLQEMLAKKRAEEEAELTFKPKKIANFKKVKAQVDNRGQEI